MLALARLRRFAGFVFKSFAFGTASNPVIRRLKFSHAAGPVTIWSGFFFTCRWYPIDS